MPAKTQKMGDEFGTLDAICEDCMQAFHSKDVKMLKAALEALIEHIREEDETQDKEDSHDAV